MKEATRSTAEWIASVTIATEPVITPAMSLSTISAALEAIEISAARVRWPRIMRSQPIRERARRAAAVRDRVLLGVGQLGHRAAVAARRRARTAGRSRSRRSPRGASATRAVVVPSNRRSAPSASTWAITQT